jgi:hypothetical protein
MLCLIIWSNAPRNAKWIKSSDPYSENGLGIDIDWND